MPNERQVPVPIEEEMRKSYLDYAMSVIVGRALPDIRDGLKPVHRRVLYTMQGLGLNWNRAYKKAARVIGDCVPNFDESEQEPVVLPTRIPNLLINGSAGIAVGMATNVPPHNLTEVIDGLVTLIDSPETTIEQLLKIVKGPDFPTRGYIYGA